MQELELFMKKLFIAITIILIGISTFAKSNKDFSLIIGTPQSDVIKVVGKPDVITKDSDNIDTWIYLDTKKLPKSNVTKSERLSKTDESTILTIKFDKENNVLSYSYMTTYIGEKDD